MSNFFSVPKISYEKPPLKLKHAIIISIIVPVVGIPTAIMIHYLLFIESIKCIIGYLLVSYWSICFSWSYLEWHTRNLAIRGHNMFVYISVVVIGFAIVFGKDHEIFPQWGVIAIFVAGIFGYSVAGFCACKNFKLWLRGELESHGEKSIT